MFVTAIIVLISSIIFAHTINSIGNLLKLLKIKSQYFLKLLCKYKRLHFQRNV